MVIREVEGREKEDYSALSSFSHHLRLILKGQGSPFFLSFSAYINLPLETTYHQGQSTKGLNMLKFNKSYSHSSFRFVFFFCLQLYPYFGSSFVPLTPNILLSKSKLLAFLSCLIAEILWSVEALYFSLSQSHRRRRTTRHLSSFRIN